MLGVPSSSFQSTVVLETKRERRDEESKRLDSKNRSTVSRDTADSTQLDSALIVWAWNNRLRPSSIGYTSDVFKEAREDYLLQSTLASCIFLPMRDCFLTLGTLHFPWKKYKYVSNRNLKASAMQTSLAGLGEKEGLAEKKCVQSSGWPRATANTGDVQVQVLHIKLSLDDKGDPIQLCPITSDPMEKRIIYYSTQASKPTYMLHQRLDNQSTKFNELLLQYQRSMTCQNFSMAWEVYYISSSCDDLERKKGQQWFQTINCELRSNVSTRRSQTILGYCSLSSWFCWTESSCKRFMCTATMMPVVWSSCFSNDWVYIWTTKKKMKRSCEIEPNAGTVRAIHPTWWL
jgi:hypothetical protein